MTMGDAYVLSSKLPAAEEAAAQAHAAEVAQEWARGN
jgi:hypothetical protein